MPGPAALWVLSALAFGVAMTRGGQGGGGARRGRMPTLHASLARRLPLPPGWAERAAGPRLRADLVAAGLAGRLEPADVARIRFALAGAGVLVGAVAAIASPAGLVLGAAAAGVGYALPALSVRRAASRRRRRIARALPDLIDVVVLCTRAGVALEPALRLAAGRLSGPCADEFTATLRAMDLGTPRREAYRDLVRRVGGAELTGLVAALLQADELGTPIADTLARQADLLRAGRRQAVRDHAAKAAPKVQLIVAMVMVPASLLLVVGVMVLQLLDQMSTLAGAAP